MTSFDPALHKVFVDTNVIFYSLDLLGDQDKRERATKTLKRIWRAHTGVISTQVIAELVVNLRRKGNLGWHRLKEQVEPYLSWEVVVLDPWDPLDAARIADAHQLSYWDGLILKAAEKAGAAFLLTEDLNPGQQMGDVQVVSPFA